MTETAHNPVFRSLNKPLTMLGVERRLFWAALTIGAATWTSFDTLIGGILQFTGLYFLAWFITQKDPQMLRILINSRRYPAMLDSSKFNPCPVEVVQ